MLQELVKLANHLDSKGLVKEADYLDRIIKSADDLKTQYPVPMANPQSLSDRAEKFMFGTERELSTPIGSDRYNRQTGKVTLEDLKIKDKSGTPIASSESYKNPYDPSEKSTFNETGAIVLKKDNPRIQNWDPYGSGYGKEMTYVDQNGRKIYGVLELFNKEHQAGVVWEKSRFAHDPHGDEE
jgi:hypothetical protein